MKKISLQKIWPVFNVVVIAVIAIYWISYQIRKDNLDRYLAQLGEKLVAALPKENTDKSIAMSYNEFRERVRNREVDPAKVEEVIANIANIEENHTATSTEAVDSLLQSILSETENLPSPEIELVYPKERWDEMAVKIPQVLESMDNIRMRASEAESLHLSINNQLQVVISHRQLEKLQNEKNKNIDKELKLLKQLNLLKIESGDVITVVPLPELPGNIEVIPGTKRDSLRIDVRSFGDSLRTIRKIVPKPEKH